VITAPNKEKYTPQLSEQDTIEIASFVESPRDQLGLLSPHVSSTLTTPQDYIVERHEQGGTPSVSAEVSESLRQAIDAVSDVNASQDQKQSSDSKETSESKGKKPVQIPKQLTIHIPKKENGGPVVVQDKQAPVQQSTPSRLIADKEEITKEWLLLLRKQKREEQELREQHKRERDEFRRSYGIAVNAQATNTQPTSQTNITVSLTQMNGTSQLESPILKAKASPPSTSKLKVLPSKQMKTVFEKLISDIESRIGEDFKSSKTTPNEIEKFTTTTQIVNELKRSQPNVYKITTTTMTTTSSVNSKAQQIMKQQRLDSKISPVIVDTLLPVNDHESPTSNNSTPSITTPNGSISGTPSKLVRSEYSKSAGNLTLLEDLHPLRLDLHHHQIMNPNSLLSEPSHRQSSSELKRSNTTASLPVHANDSDELISLMTKNIDLLMNKDSSSTTPRVLSPKDRKSTGLADSSNES
jgi:hypothetical protein